MVWLVVVPTRVTATGVSPARPAAMSSAAMASKEPRADSSTNVRLSPYVDQSILGPHATTDTSRWFCVVRGIPAYAGTALTAETPGTSSKPMSALRQAWASSGPEA